MPEAAALPTVEEAVALGLTRDEYALIVEKLGREPNQVELAMFSLLWSEHCAYKHSKKLLRTLPTEGAHVLVGPGRERRASSTSATGSRCAFKVESHNHPSAVEPFQGAATGVGGILRDIFALGARPDRGARLAALRRAGDERALALPARRRGARHRPLRQLDRRADDRRRDLLRGAVRAELPRQRDGARPRRARQARAQRRGRRRQPARPLRRLDRPRRHRRRVGAGERRARRGRRGQAPDRAGRRPVRGEQARRVLARAARAGPARRAAGPRRRGPHVERVRDGVEGRGRHRHPRRPRAAARAGHGAVRDHGQRVAGADALRRRAEPGRRGARADATSGRSTAPSSAR